MVVAETVLYVAMVCGERRKAEDRVISFSSKAPIPGLLCKVQASVPLLPAKTFEQAIREDFATIPEIRNVKIEQERGEILVWIGVNEPPQALRYKIYDKQASLIESFPDMTFDFRLKNTE
jgi:hypothetical protein